jgi:hypothetical protein
MGVAQKRKRPPEKRTAPVRGAAQKASCQSRHPSPTPVSASTQVEQRTIKLDDINEGGAQMRVEMSANTVVEYIEAIRDGAVFPAIIVYEDESGIIWLADGFHRKKASVDAGRTEILAEVRRGSSRDAILHGVSANASHGLRRTQADKRHAVETLLKDPTWAKWSDRKIGEAARVDHKTVAVVRRELSGEIPTPKVKPVKAGEIPTPKASNGMTEHFLFSLTDEQLLDECRRRGLKVPR